MQHYNYIFTGTGLAALMTALEMAQSGKYSHSKILLIDKVPKQTNDRTWCYWEREPGPFESIVSSRWDGALFADNKVRRLMNLAPYQYKMIKGIDFYNFVLERLKGHKNFEFLHENVLEFSEANGHITVRTENHAFTCDKLLNSILNHAPLKNQTKFPVLQQHFVGWFIKTAEPAFNPNAATFMDFSIEQNGNTRFMYVLPFSKTEALIEYTLFSEKLLPQTEYEHAIKSYLTKLKISNYNITGTENGSIPMTSFPFWDFNTKNLINIGSAGGWTKASTGYTFKNTIKKSAALAKFMLSEADFSKFHKKSRFYYYDMLLLDILSKQNELGSQIFSSLFQKGNPNLILKFLDEQTLYYEDLQVIAKCPTSLFIKALYNRIMKKPEKIQIQKSLSD